MWGELWGKIQHRRSCGVSRRRAALQCKIKGLGHIVFSEMPQIEFSYDDRFLFNKLSDRRTRVTDPQRGRSATRYKGTGHISQLQRIGQSDGRFCK